MKVFFGLLLIANIAFAAFQWLLPYEQMFTKSTWVPPARSLKLLRELNQEPVSESEIIAEVEAETRAIEAALNAIESEMIAEQQQQLTEEQPTPRICYTIGPITDKALAAEISGRYSARQVETTLKSNVEKEYSGVMVYIGGYRNRAEALKTADTLSEYGINEHIVIDRDDSSKILSLGVFGLKRNADRLKQRVEQLKFKAQTEPRYRQRTIYWLYGQQPGDIETVRLLKDEDYALGISQTANQCS